MDAKGEAKRLVRLPFQRDQFTPGNHSLINRCFIVIVSNNAQRHLFIQRFCPCRRNPTRPPCSISGQRNAELILLFFLRSGKCQLDGIFLPGIPGSCFLKMFTIMHLKREVKTSWTPGKACFHIIVVIAQLFRLPHTPFVRRNHSVNLNTAATGKDTHCLKFPSPNQAWRYPIDQSHSIVKFNLQTAAHPDTTGKVKPKCLCLDRPGWKHHRSDQGICL